MSNIIQRGADVPISCTHSTALNLQDGYAIHLRVAGQKSETPIAKYANTATTGYEIRLFDTDLSATPATFEMKLDKDFTAGLDPEVTIEGMIYTQSTDTDYSSNDLRPSTAWTEIGITTSELLVTTEIGA